MAEPPDGRDPEDLTPPDGWVRPSERLERSSHDDEATSAHDAATTSADDDVITAEPVHVDATAAGEATSDEPAGADDVAGGDETAAAPAGRGARRRASRRNRRRALAGVAALALIVAAVGGVLVATSGGTTTKAVRHRVHVLTTTTVPGPPPPALVATTKVASLQVYDAPNGKVVGQLSAKTDYNQPRTLLVSQVQSGWLQVLLPQKPNDTTGWVRTSDTSQSTTDYAMKVSLSQHHLWLTKAGAPVVDTAVVIGAAQTPTPTGLFYVTDPVNLTTSPNGPYGAYAIGLSGYSNTLQSFDGGPPQIAVHGTPYPDQVGQDLSNGCVRVPNPVILQIATVVPLGTPVTITA